ncbi:MAG: hypothetical protein GXP31_18140 [Kiritimatiellaeota bacterium]|nr:hypothetical protein [Kiritimatiellota bacterium]
METTRFGMAAREITPASDSERSGLRILGFRHERAKPYTEVRDPLFVRVAVMAAAGRAACLVALDLIGDAVGLSRRARQAITRATGIHEDRVLVACTHAHTTPETIALSGYPVNPAWLDAVVQAAAEAARAAFDALQPAELLLEDAPVPGINLNRRSRHLETGRAGSELTDEQRRRATLVDHRLRVLHVRPGIGDECLGMLLNFACHPVAVQTQPFLSADYPGLLVRRIETTAAAPALFFNGACGDLNPVRKDGYTDAEWTARRLADSALGRSGECSRGAPLQVHRICGVRTTLRLPRRPIADLDLLQDERRQLTEALAAANSAGDADRARALGRRLFSVNERLALAALPKTLEAEIQAVTIGDWIVVGVPGELFCCLGEDIRRAASRRRVWVIGYANGYLGYIAPAEAHRVGGYEVSPGRWSPLAPGAGEQIRDAAVELVRRLDEAC